MANITWSYSSLNEYATCPRQYNETRVLGRFTKETSPQMQYGTDVHLALEEYIRDGKPLGAHSKFYPIVEHLKALPGVKYPEHKMAVSHDKTVCDFDDPERWVRGIADLIIVDGNRALIVDYKTGSNRYPDTKQLHLMALMTFAHFNEVDSITAQLSFVVHNTVVNAKYTREETTWDAFTPTLMALYQSFEKDVWPATPTPLCKWCPVTTCPFN